MPTDVIKAVAAKRKTAAQADANNAIILMSLIVCLIVLMLLFVSPSLAQTMCLVGQFE
jgi:hypothetical protein